VAFITTPVKLECGSYDTVHVSENFGTCLIMKTEPDTKHTEGDCVKACHDQSTIHNFVENYAFKATPSLTIVCPYFRMPSFNFFTCMNVILTKTRSGGFATSVRMDNSKSIVPLGSYSSDCSRMTFIEEFIDLYGDGVKKDCKYQHNQTDNLSLIVALRSNTAFWNAYLSACEGVCPACIKMFVGNKPVEEKPAFDAAAASILRAGKVSIPPVSIPPVKSITNWDDLVDIPGLEDVTVRRSSAAPAWKSRSKK